MNPVKRKLVPGDFLFMEGHASTSFFIVLSGVVSLSNERGGKLIESERVTANRIVGDLNFLSPQPRAHVAKAVSECELLEIPYAEIQGDLKSLPGWTQLMLKTLTERLRNAERELKSHLAESSQGKLGPDEFLESVATLRTAFMSVPQEDGAWSWEKIREYAVQVFQVPALKIEPVVGALQRVGWLKTTPGAEGLEKLAEPNLQRILDFESFLRKFKSSRTKRGMVEVTDHDIAAVNGLVGAADNVANAKGVATVSLSSALAIAKSDPFGKTFRVEHFDLLLEKGLDATKESSDGEVRLTFSLADMKTLRENWTVLRSS